MNRVISVIIIIVIILGVLLIGAYFILKNEMRPEKIAQRVEAIAVQYGYDIAFSGIDYSISLNGINAALYDVNVEGSEVALLSGKINLNLDIMRFLFQEIIIRDMTVYNGIFIIKEFEYDSSQTDTVSEKQKYALSSDIFLRNCMIIYDTLTADSINGSLTLTSDGKIAITGNLKFKTNLSHIRHLGYIETSFALISGRMQNLIIRNLSLGDIGAMSGNIKLRNDTVAYNIRTRIIDTDTLLRIFKMPFNASGIVELEAEGILCLADSLKQHMGNIKSAAIGASHLALKYEDINVLLSDGNSFIKSGDSILIETGVKYRERIFNINANISYAMLINNILRTRLTCTNADLSIINHFTDQFSIKGKADIFSELTMPLDSMQSKKAVINAVNGSIVSDRIDILADTVGIVIQDVDVAKKGEIAEITAIALYRGFDVHINGTVHIPDSLISASLTASGNVSSLAPDYWGKCSLSGDGEYSVKDKKIQASTTFSILDASGTGLTDTFDITGENVSLSGTDRIDMKNINIGGKYIEGSIAQMSFLFNNNPVIDLDAQIAFINMDSLFPITDSIPKQASPKPVIPDDLEIYYTAHCDRAVFRNENISSIVFSGQLYRDSLIVDSFRGNAVKGTAEGYVLYMPETGFIHIDSRINGMDLNDFLTRHPISPYDMGGSVDAHSKLSLYQDSMTKTVNGHVQTEIKGGYMLSPDVLKNISNVIRYPVSDTFFFDNMYGEFDIADEMVSFDDFIMEKNGHSLLYSGNVDFNKLIFVNGMYGIDLNAANTGMFETLLRNTGYKADTLGVQFELKGDYKRPTVNIKKNSIGEYLKTSTQQVVDDFIEGLNNIF